MIDVLIVDDSAVMRMRIRQALETDPSVRVVGFARNGREAVEKALALEPHVITMDIQMPHMSGIEAVRVIMAQRPMAILMLSSLTQHGAAETILALELGAVDYLSKDSLTNAGLLAKIHSAAGAAIAPICKSTPAFTGFTGYGRPYSACAIGISTGGPKALAALMPKLSPDIGAPILIAQHMPPVFTRSLAERLDALSAIRVKEAADQECLQPGWAYICPGGFHIELSDRRRIVLSPREQYPKHAYVPSADLLMASMGRVFGREALCIIMTGMGLDGTEGVRQARAFGSHILAQSEASSTIYGMPKGVIDRSLQNEIIDLERLHEVMNAYLKPPQ